MDTPKQVQGRKLVEMEEEKGKVGLVREIKFRAYSSAYQTRIDDVQGVIATGYFEQQFWQFLESPDWAVVQYTGLKVKNETEVYAGDVIFRDRQDSAYPKDSWDRKYLVKHGYDGWIYVESLCPPHHDIGWLRLHNPTTFAVIGNIYENPELIEDEQL